jgi:hypothetical protein
MICTPHPPVSILSPLNPVHTPTSLFLKIHLNIILPSMPRSRSGLYPSGFPTITLYTTLPHTRYMPAHLMLLDFITRTIAGEQYRSRISPLCSFLHSPVNPPLLSPSILLNTLFSNTLSLRSSPNVSDQVSHQYKITGKIIVLYILIFKFLESNK